MGEELNRQPADVGVLLAGLECWGDEEGEVDEEDDPEAIVVMVGPYGA